MAVGVTIPFPPDLFEALAQRVAALLAEQPPVQRFLDAEAAATYTGLPLKTLRTRSWRERAGIPVRQLAGGRLVFDRLALDDWLASSRGASGGGYAVVRVAADGHEESSA